MAKTTECKNCDIRRLYASKFDVHFSKTDCPFDCETQMLKGMSKPEKKIAVFAIAEAQRLPDKQMPNSNDMEIAAVYVKNAINNASVVKGRMYFNASDTNRLPPVAIDLINLAVKSTAEAIQ